MRTRTKLECQPAENVEYVITGASDQLDGACGAILMEHDNKFFGLDFFGEWPQHEGDRIIISDIDVEESDCFDRGFVHEVQAKDALEILKLIVRAWDVQCTIRAV